jgi:hypothetical protein
MPYVDLLRLTVLLIAGAATAIGGVSVIAAGSSDDTTTLIVAAAWWPVAAGLGTWLGRPARAADAMSQTLAEARTATALPDEQPGRIAIERLWPVGAFALLCGGVAWIWPQVAAIGAGYCVLWALGWRSREACVTGVEDRDGVRFYVESSSAFRPLRLVRTPGLGSDRAPAGHPPPPEPAEEPAPSEPATP